jgi:hypothetical protein
MYMSRFNTSSNHPIIPNSQEYVYEKKFVSIHAEDRDILRYPSSSEFEIELPQDYCNVQAVKLNTWTFPANYNTFSLIQNNISMTFKITKPYNPGDYSVTDPLLYVIFQALYDYGYDKNFLILIEEGFYNPIQVATELTNRFNNSVTSVILNYMNSQSVSQTLIDEFNNAGGYTQFVVVYNQVAQKLWFGNKSSEFILTNDSELYALSILKNVQCFRTQLPDFSNWGLPAYLGFTRCPVPATPPVPFPNVLPRFYYGDVSPGDNGYWLVPDPEYGACLVYYLEAPAKINLMGNSYFYMELAGLNNMDETMPFSANSFTTHTNVTNGIVNSSFAKIAITTTPIAQWFDNGCDNYKYFNPPAERIRKLKIKLRYHNNLLVEFGTFDYSFTLEFCILRPQNQKDYKMFVPEVVKFS